MFSGAIRGSYSEIRPGPGGGWVCKGWEVAAEDVEEQVRGHTHFTHRG